MNEKKVLVIGGSSGIGEAIAKGCLDLGAQVTVASHQENSLRLVSDRLGTGVEVALLDVAVESEVQAFLGRVGPQDHVVFCAEAVQRGSFVDLPIATARQNLEVKFWGTWHTAKYMQVKAGGSFTFFSGSISRMPAQSVVPVSIINSALDTLCRGLAFELAPLRVNCISPGTVDTPAWLHLTAAARNALFAKQRAVLPLKRIGTPADVAAAALMVMQNEFMTGTVIDIDGGALLGNAVP